MKRGNKKGSHVGVMISFVIFVTFLVFLYTLAQPSLNLPQTKKAILDQIEKQIIPKVSSNIETITLDVGGISSNCIEIGGFISEYGLSQNIAVKNNDGENIPVYISSGDSNTLIINRNSGDENLIKILYSDEFPENSVQSISCYAASPGEYSVGFVKNESYIFESKVLEIINNYGEYEEVKTSLGISPENEFGIGLIYNNGTTVETENPGSSVEVYVKQTTINYIDLNGGKRAGFIKTKTW